jgi:hypothetical protein
VGCEPLQTSCIHAVPADKGLCVLACYLCLMIPCQERADNCLQFPVAMANHSH